VLFTALGIGLVAVLALAGIMSAAVRDGLFNNRINHLNADFAQSAATARNVLIAASADTAEDVQSLLVAVVQDQVTTGQGVIHGVLLAPATDQGLAISAVAMPVAASRLISPELRAATNAGNQQMWQSVGIPADMSGTGSKEPGVVFGTLVDVPVYGSFGFYLVYSMAGERETLTMIQTTLAVGAAIVLVIIGGIVFVETRLTIRPVHLAAKGAERLAGGNLDERLDVKGEDELATLAMSFNDMAASMQAQIQQLEEYSQVQKRFVSDVSHELRTPLTTMRMASEMIYSSRDEFEPHVKRSAELLQGQIDRFEDLLADLLEMSRYDGGAVTLDIQERDLVAITRFIRELATPLAEKRGVPVTIEAKTDPIIAEVEGRRVERILRNLIANAIDHADGTPVRITLDANAECAAIVVRDYGVGLSPRAVEHVFDRFWRADPSRARTTGGTGLGLPIALEDAQLHGGNLEAWGEPDKGAAFRLLLPIHPGLPISNPPLPLIPDDAGEVPR
jgi:two-component system sensor histidine kinase MtrB